VTPDDPALAETWRRAVQIVIDVVGR